jgi:hypothetical protein
MEDIMHDKEASQAYIDELKKEGCSCGEARIDVLLFHHRDPSTKEHRIGPHMTVDAIRKEAEKCDIMCHNCHTAYHRKHPVKVARKPMTEARRLAKIGACIARGIHLRESLSQLPYELVVDIHKITKAIVITKEVSKEAEYLVPI